VQIKTVPIFEVGLDTSPVGRLKREVKNLRVSARHCVSVITFAKLAWTMSGRSSKSSPRISMNT
jgi:hypothetical protein